FPEFRDSLYFPHPVPVYPQLSRVHSESHICPPASDTAPAPSVLSLSRQDSCLQPFHSPYLPDTGRRPLHVLYNFFPSAAEGSREIQQPQQLRPESEPPRL